MKRKLRQRRLVELLETESELTVQEVCHRLELSEATVRREFVELVSLGIAERTWGGIKSKHGGFSIAPPAFTHRLSAHIEEKRSIARAAANLLQDGDVVMIDGGTTTFQLCPFIAPMRIRVITNSLVIAHEMDRLKGALRGAEILLTGGVVQPDSGLVCGPPAELFLNRYRAKWAFLSAAGLDESAATNYNESVLNSEQLMIAQSSQVALLVDSSKLGHTAMSVLCPLAQIDVLVTCEARLPLPLREALSKEGVQIVSVPHASDESRSTS